MPSFFVLSLVVLSSFANAFHLPFEGRRSTSNAHQMRRALQSTLALKNSQDISYYTNLTLGGQTYSVVIDTGSSDLWVIPEDGGNVPSSVDTGFSAKIVYASGQASGPIKTADLAFAGYDIANQSFVQVAQSQAPNGITGGLIGLGPNMNSVINGMLPGFGDGFGPLDNIFLQNITTPNRITFLLGRTEDETDVFPGNMTVGTILEGYEDVEKQPKIPLDPLAGHYQFLGAEDSIIAPDGKPVTITTSVLLTKNPKQPTIVLDTGFSLTQVPKSVAEALYGGYDGAELTNISAGNEAWIVPCETEVKFSFKFGGVTIPVHPLDATMSAELFGVPKESLKNSEGTVSCVGSFQPVSFDTRNEFDIILGMSFLRNVYMLVNMGDFVGDGAGTLNRGDPFVQFLPTTEVKEAHENFVSVRVADDEDDTNDAMAYRSSLGLTVLSALFMIYVVVLKS